MPQKTTSNEFRDQLMNRLSCDMRMISSFADKLQCSKLQLENMKFCMYFCRKNNLNFCLFINIYIHYLFISFSLSPTDTYPIIKDHGWSWVIACTAHVCRILHDGIVTSFGVILPILSFEFDTDVWEIGFTVSLMVVVGSVLGKFTLCSTSRLDVKPAR